MVTMSHTTAQPVINRARASAVASWSAFFGNLANSRSASTFEYCGTGGYMCTDSIQVVTNKPHAYPGVSPGVLT
ncbi:MAG: hypothetical protein AAGF73_00450 [Actinomycetota bacterium]